MKNAKKIGLALILTVALVIGTVFAIIASSDRYKGDVAKFAELAEKALEAETMELKEEALVAVETYLLEKPVDPEAGGYADAMNNYTQARADIIALYVAAVGNNDASNVKVKYSQLADKWFRSAFDGNETDARYAATLAALSVNNLSVYGILYDAIDQTAMALVDSNNDTATAIGNYKYAKQFIERAVVDKLSAEYNAAAEELAKLVKKNGEWQTARYNALIADAKMADYSVNKALYQNKFEGSSSPLSLSNNSGYTSTGLSLKNTGAKVTEVLPDGQTNSYFEININGAMNAAGTSYLSTYATLSFSGVTDRFILEFDIKTNTTLPNVVTHFQNRWSGSNGSNAWMDLKPNGDIVDDTGAVVAAKAVVPGEWTHISIVCDIEKINESRLYVDYAFAGYLHGDHKGIGETPSNMRIGNAGNSSGQLCLDNIYISNRGSFCDPEYVNNMEKLDRFIYLVNYMQRTDMDKEVFIDVPDCDMANKQAKAIADDFYYIDAETGAVVYRDIIESLEDEEKKAAAKRAVDDYLSYDPLDVMVKYKKENLVKYDALVKALENAAKAPTSASISARNKLSQAVLSFTNANNAYIFRPGDDNKDMADAAGTLEDPYILTHGEHAFVYDLSKGNGWVYLKYTALDAGALTFSLGGDNAVLGLVKGGTVNELGSKDYRVELAAGDEIILAIKSSKVYDSENAKIDDMTISASFTLPLLYDDIATRYGAEITRIDEDNAILSFINTMDGFEKASSATLLQSLYDKVSATISELNTGLLGSGEENDPYYKFYNHYHVTYANAMTKIEEAKMTSNSKNIIDSVNYILARYPAEADWKLVYIENPVTDEDKANNETFEYIERYVTMIRDKYTSGSYNPDFINDAGITVDMAMQKLENMNDYYYGILQKKHADIMAEQFLAYAATDSYFEKMGIISYIQRYLNSEDVDFKVEFVCQNDECAGFGVYYSGDVKDIAAPACPICDTKAESFTIVSGNADIQAVISKYVAYEAELAPQEENYTKLLEQNTIYFINTVKKFDTAITYVDKLALLNEAMPYYYLMNIASDEVAESIAIYDALQAELGVVQKNSADFIETVLLLPVVLDERGVDAYYEYLVTALTLAPLVDESIDGVSEAEVAFEKAYDEYTATIGKANSEIGESIEALGSLGANCGLTAVLAVVLKHLLTFN